MKTLKKSFAILLLSTAIASCAKKSNEELIIGTWNCTSAKLDNVEAMGTSIQSLKWTFNENGTGYAIVSIPNDGVDTSNFTYIINDNELKIVDTNTDTYEIEKLTETKLEIHGDIQNGPNTTHVDAKFDKM